MKKLNFNHGIGDTLIQTVMAQKMFDEWFKQEIEGAHLVYGSIEGSKVVQLFGQVPGCNDKHTARLIDIREIKKDCAKHEPKNFEEYTINWKIICKHCGVELQATWKPVDSSSTD